MNSIYVSVVIVNWNTKKLLNDCIRSIRDNTTELKYEIIVIDNASTDGSVEMLNSQFPSVIVIANDQNKGFAAANNQGILKSKGRFILLLNSDTLVLQGAINKAVAFADQNKDAAVVGCRALNADETIQRTCFKFPSVLNILLSSTYLYKLFKNSPFFGRERPLSQDQNEIQQVDVVTGCFMLTRRKAIDEVGMMDERFFMYAEETDWCYRFAQSGWKVMFIPHARIIHFGGQSSSKVKAQMLVQLRMSILMFIDKHQNWLKHKLACFFTILFFTFRLPIWALIFLLKHKERQLAAIRLRAYLAGIGQVFLNSTYHTHHD